MLPSIVTGDHQNLKIHPWHVNLYPQTCKPLRADPCDLTLNSHSGLWTIVDCFLKLLTLAFTTSIYTFKPFPFSRFQTWMITASPQGFNFHSQAPSWFSLNPTPFPWTLTVYCIPFNYIVQEPSLYALKYSIFALALSLFFHRNLIACPQTLKVIARTIGDWLQNITFCLSDIFAPTPVIFFCLLLNPHQLPFDAAPPTSPWSIDCPWAFAVSPQKLHFHPEVLSYHSLAPQILPLELEWSLSVQG